MKCPDCGKGYACPCKACTSRQPDKEPWIRTDDWCEACPQCGVVRSMDEWMEIEMTQYKSKAK